MTKATDLQNRIRLELSEQQVGTFWRANSGMAWAGEAITIRTPQAVRVGPGDVVIRNARPFHGMPEGFLDLIGIVPVKITADMVGKTVGVFTAIDSKHGTGRLSPAQRNMIDLIRLQGGRAGEARTPGEAVQIARGIAK